MKPSCWNTTLNDLKMMESKKIDPILKDDRGLFFEVDTATYENPVTGKVGGWGKVKIYGKHKKIRDADILLSMVYFGFTFALLGVPMSYGCDSSNTIYAAIS